MRFRIVNTDGQGANMRPTPDTQSAPIGALPEGAQINGDEHAWRSVSDSASNQGFVADEFLVASGNAFHIGNTDGLGANLRAQPDTGAAIVLALPEGTQ